MEKAISKKQGLSGCILFEEDYALLPVRYKEEVLWTKVDFEDSLWLYQHSWCIRNGYPATTYNGKLTDIHKIIMPTPAGFVCDHLSRDKLDNRRSNLRIATPQQNATNTTSRPSETGRRGVYYDRHSKRQKKYKAAIRHHGKLVTVGYFATEEEAAAARDKKAEELNGQFAVLNQL